MRSRSEVELAGVRVPIAELTASMIDRLLSTMEAGLDMTRLDQLMLIQKHIPEFGLDMITEPVKLGELIDEHDLAPSEFVAVYEEAARINPFLFQALTMYREKQERVTELQRALHTTDGSDVPPFT